MKIAIFYHCKIRGSGIPDELAAQVIVGEQLQALHSSELLEHADEFTIGIDGDARDRDLIDSVCPCARVLIVPHNGRATFEFGTLELLRQSLRPGWAVLYHHSKGVTQPQDTFHHTHRRTMERHLVWEWRKCVRALECGCDAVGINLVHEERRPVLPGTFFAGNFWWARSDYAMSLPPINVMDSIRTNAEGWITRSGIRPFPRLYDFERPELYRDVRIS